MSSVTAPKSEVTLFTRKASGLVRAWSVFDAFVYALFSINLITLGLFIFSYCWSLNGHMVPAIIISAAFTILEVIVYASLISAMPRAGGDYVWQSRVLGRTVGFILAVTGWWFILWLWVPLYGQMLTYEVFTPLLAIAGAKDAALWFTNDPSGLFWACFILCILVSFYIGIGMKWYARIQKACFWGGMVGLLLAFILLLFGNNQTFVNNLNSLVPAMFGAQGTEFYQATLKAGEAAGTVAPPWGNMALGASLVVIPMLVFWNLWPNWGSTLYGEVRGANDYKRNFWGMAAAVIATAVLAIVFFALIAKTLGWDFYNKANGAFWAFKWGYAQDAPPLPFWPYPGLLAAFLTTSPALQFIVVLLLSLWWFGWSGTVFLSSTRVIFAAAFDRLLPDWVSRVEPRTRTPIFALLLMTIPSLIISYLYAYNLLNFQTLALDATLVIAVTFLGTTVAGTILPWRSKDVYDGSPIVKFKVPGWASWLALILYALGAIYLIINSVRYGITVTGSLPGAGADALTWIIVILVWVLTVVNAAILVWVLYYVAPKVMGKEMPVITFAGLLFMFFLDWLLVEWVWDPNKAYGIGWSNPSSMLFMVANYVVAAVIYFGFSAYRRRQGIDIDKVYKQIPVE
jgi:APA family basic amino acid/polyamine antiporter